MAQVSAMPPALQGLSPGGSPNRAPSSSAKERAAAVAQDFEAVFLNSMFQEMFAGVDGDGPFGGGTGVGVWRSFLSEEYAKSFAKGGGIGIGSQVYATLLKLQEAATP
jgi:Rod binding domain-containing protein